jgi:hypothetical protein
MEISPVKTKTQSHSPKATIKSTGPRPGKTGGSFLGSVVNIADQVTIGGREPDQSLLDAKKLRNASLVRPPSGAANKPSVTSAPKNGRCGGTLKISGGTTPQVPKHHEGNQALAEINKHRYKQHQKKLSDLAKMDEIKRLLKQDVPSPKPATRAEVPDVSTKTKLKPNKAAGLRAFGLFSSLHHTVQGAMKINKGESLEGSLQIVGGAADGVESVGHVGQALNGGKTSVAVGGGKVARMAGPAAAVTFAALDAKHAADAFRSGNEVAGTEHAMNSAWSAASAVPVAAPGALAHSVTRFAMGLEVNGTSGDKIVTGGIDSVLNRGLNQKVQSRDRRDISAANEFSTLRGDALVDFIRRNPKTTAQGITGILTALGQEKGDTSKRREIQKTLLAVRMAQQQVGGIR